MLPLELWILENFKKNAICNNYFRLRSSFSKQTNTNKSRFSWCRRTGAREAVLLFTRRCWQPLRNLFPHSLHYGTMFLTNWSSNGGLAAEASVTCRRSQWSNSSHFSLLFSPPKRFFCDMTTTPKLGTKDLLKAQRWVVERESNLLPLLYKLNSLTPIPSHPPMVFLQRTAGNFTSWCHWKSYYLWERLWTKLSWVTFVVSVTFLPKKLLILRFPDFHTQS